MTDSGLWSERTPLPARIGDVLDAEGSAAAMHRIAAGVRARRRASVARWIPGVLVGCTATAIIVISILSTDSSEAPAVAQLAPPAEFAPDSVVELADGSSIATEASAQLSTLESSERSVVLHLKQGRAEFSVTPGTPRRWTIECGMVSVEVVGTVFAIERQLDPESVTVSVERGAVLVRGDSVTDQVRRLTAGESIVVEAQPVSQSAALGPAVIEEPLPVETEAETTESRTRTPVPRGGTTWERLVADGEYEQAFEALGANGLARATRRERRPSQLFALADIARLSGHPEQAVDPLERLLALHPTDARAPLAAFTLGRIRLDGGQPRQAIADFERARSLPLPDRLRAAALAHLSHAYDRSGDEAGAIEAAQTYLREYPNGPRRAAMHAVIGAETAPPP